MGQFDHPNIIRLEGVITRGTDEMIRHVPFDLSLGQVSLNYILYSVFHLILFYTYVTLSN